MPKVLITAFEPYDRWTANASWLTLVELTRELPAEPAVTTRLYPVDFERVRAKLTEDLQANYDFALHIGQSPGSPRVQLESIGLNIGGCASQPSEQFEALVADGPIAYRSRLPLSRWATKIRSAGIPVQVSYHAGTYLCNAILYLSHYLAEKQGLSTAAAFVHVPLDPSQIVAEKQDIASLPKSMSAQAIRLILEELCQPLA